METQDKEVITSIILGLRTYNSKPNEKFKEVENFTVFTCLDLESGESFDQHIKTEKVKDFVQDENNLLGKNGVWPIVVFSFEWSRSKTAAFRKFQGLTVSQYHAKLTSDLPDQKSV